MDDTYKQQLEAVRAARREIAQRPTLGRRFEVPRHDQKGVQTILYRPSTDAKFDKLPVLFNMHGGAWIGGDAVFMESFCQMIADQVPAFVVNVNYTKADEEPIRYAIDEIVDAVNYFAAHADEYGIDPARMAVGGHSAGGHLAAGAAMKLKEDGVSLACQMLVYPVTDLTVDQDQPIALIRQVEETYFTQGGNDHRYLSPLRADDEHLAGLSHAIFITCGTDELKPMGIAYAKRLMDASVPVKVKDYPDAQHGFLEVNRPDYPAGDPRQNAEQEAYCRDCENYLVHELRACYAEV